MDTFAFAGHDTTAMGLTWIVYLLGRNKDVQKKVYDEVDQIFGGGAPVNRDNLKKLHYMDRCLKEASRLYGSVPFFGRITSQECEIAGFVVPRDMNLMVCTYNVHRNPRIWKNPEKFDPDRFSKENSAGRHPFAHVPFSAGARNCIGQRFAVQEEKALLLLLVKNFDFTSHDAPEDIEMIGEMILRPKAPLNISFKKRIC